jgi:predicted transcriptional regulator
MNQELQDLIDTANKLCKNLEEYAIEEQKQSEEICSELEVMSWQIHCMAEELKLIKAYKELDLRTENEFERQVG